MTQSDESAPVLYIVGCAAPPVLEIADPIKAAQARGWDTCLILTPSAARWRADDLDGLATLTGHPVRADYKLPGQPDVLPPATAVLVAPASSNTINKWALGISDTLALGLITEGIGKGFPIVALPHLNAAQAAHPRFEKSVQELRDAGVRILHGEADGHLPHYPGGPRPPFPWDAALDALPSPR